MSDTWNNMGALEGDHDLTITIPGDAESLRARLPAALERVGYKVLSEQPLLAKRGAVKGARYACSFEPLDYPTKLMIGLKPVSQHATQATFSYEIKSAGWGIFEGDKETLLREAEAIAALALSNGAAPACGACGTAATDDSRFCRRCGAPLVADTPELEIYRLARGTRAGWRSATLGAVMVLSLLALMAAVDFLGLGPFKPKLIKVFMILGAIWGTFGVWGLIEGLWQLHRTLTSPAWGERAAPQVLSGPPLNALPPRPAHFSVTEQTTGLLTPEPAPRAPLFAEARDTAEMEAPRARYASGDI
jgi:hypothetical protein